MGLIYIQESDETIGRFGKEEVLSIDEHNCALSLTTEVSI